jgi:hypothetical protein
MREKIEVIIWDHFDEGEAVMDAADDIMKELLSTDIREKIVDILEEYLPHPSDDEYLYAADAIMAAFTGETQ